jgi:hypothetical protein
VEPTVRQDKSNLGRTLRSEIDGTLSRRQVAQLRVAGGESCLVFRHAIDLSEAAFTCIKCNAKLCLMLNTDLVGQRF